LPLWLHRKFIKKNSFNFLQLTCNKQWVVGLGSPLSIHSLGHLDNSTWNKVLSGLEPFINKVWQVYSNNRSELSMFMCNLVMGFFLGLLFGVQKLCTCPCDPSLLSWTCHPINLFFPFKTFFWGNLIEFSILNFTQNSISFTP
jgi:hypothetical protein